MAFSFHFVSLCLWWASSNALSWWYNLSVQIWKSLNNFLVLIKSLRSDKSARVKWEWEWDGMKCNSKNSFYSSSKQILTFWVHHLFTCRFVYWRPIKQFNWYCTLCVRKVLEVGNNFTSKNYTLTLYSAYWISKFFNFNKKLILCIDWW